MLTDAREYLARLQIDGHTIGEDHDDDPILFDAQGRAVDTWRENYPYEERMPREEYDEQKYLLQVELLKFQTWAADTQSKHVLLFEGRDAAGKGGTIKRFMEHLNPRYARIVALTKPSDSEQNQWYFQRYVQYLPTAGEIVLFDRSWYNIGPALSVSWGSPPRPTTSSSWHRRPCSRRDARRRWNLSHQVLVLGHPGPNSAPASSSVRSTLSGSGSSHRSTSSRWTSGTATPTRRKQ